MDLKLHDVIRAIHFSESHSRGLSRSGSDEPVLVHHIEVGELVAVCLGNDVPATIAGILHDDCEIAADLYAQSDKSAHQTILSATTFSDGIVDAAIAHRQEGALAAAVARRDLIRDAFGQEVADLVWENTDDPRLSKSHQKAFQLRTMPHKSEKARVIKLADAFSNTHRLHTHPPQWMPSSIHGYARSRRALHEAARGTNRVMDLMWDGMWAEVASALGIAT